MKKFIEEKTFWKLRKNVNNQFDDDKLSK